MTQSRRNMIATQKPAATNSRNFRTFLLMEQLAAKEIGGRIKQARRERGLTQPDLAAVASFSARSLQDYENGVTIPYKHLAEISKLLNRPTEWFLYGNETSGGDEERLSRVEAVAEESLALLIRIAHAVGIETEESDPDEQEERRDVRARRQAV
jgi:transcriptional regulator with XRE-family HTH domain